MIILGMAGSGIMGVWYTLPLFFQGKSPSSSPVISFCNYFFFSWEGCEKTLSSYPGPFTMKGTPFPSLGIKCSNPTLPTIIFVLSIMSFLLEELGGIHFSHLATYILAPKGLPVFKRT